MTLQKSICIPATPPVDVGPFMPLIEHPHFQRLRERKQLGINYLVFPGAVHTRFEHTIGVLALTQRLCRIQSLCSKEQRLLQVFALLHDIGHGPFSHQIEPVLQGDHHIQGLKRLQDMRQEIAACDVKLHDVETMLLGTHPLAPWISDRNLGTDKLDYLMRDALHIGFHGTPDIEKIQFYTERKDKSLAIEQKFMEDAKQLQKFYSYLHQHGYLNKTALAAQRMLQRAVQEELISRNEVGDNLWDMTDHQLMAWLEQARHPVARRLVENLFNRQLHRTFLTFKAVGYSYVERQADKPLQVREWTRTDLRHFAEYIQKPDNMLELEDTLARSCGLKPGDILFAAMPYFKKLVPKDLRVFSANSSQDFWLLEKDIDHMKSLESDYLRTFAIRLLAPEKHRVNLASAADDIVDIVNQCIPP